MDNFKYNLERYRKSQKESAKRKRKRLMEKAKYDAKIASLRARKRKAASSRPRSYNVGSDPFRPAFGMQLGESRKKRKKRSKYVKVYY